MGPRRRKWRRRAVKAALAALAVAALALLGSGDGEELLAAALAAWVERGGDPGGDSGPGGAGEAWGGGWGGGFIDGGRGNGAGMINGERGNWAGIMNGERGNGAGLVNGERGNWAGLVNGGAGDGKRGSGVLNGSWEVTNAGLGGPGGKIGGPGDGIGGGIGIRGPGVEIGVEIGGPGVEIGTEIGGPGGKIGVGIGGPVDGTGGPVDGTGGPRAPPACLGLLSGGSGDLSSLPPRDPRTPRALLAPPPCAPPTPPFLLTLVPSAPAHRERRGAVRDTWGSPGGTPRGRTVFVLGLPDSAQGQRELLRESRRHGDILQGDFADSYGNLTRKTLLLLRWARACCAAAAFLLKADDDVFVDAPAVATYLAAWRAAPPRLYLGRVHWAVRPDRDPRGRHHVPAAVYAESRYPPYCSGTAYVLSRQAAAAVLGAGRAVPLALPEDVWVGLGARGAGVAPRHWARLGGALRAPAGGRCCLGAALVSAHGVGPRDMRRQWAGLHREGAGLGEKGAGLKEEGAGPAGCPWFLRGALGRVRCRVMAWGEGMWGERR